MPQQISIFDLVHDGQNCVGGGLHCLRWIRFEHAYKDIISLENLLEAWKEFIKGKRSRKDVQKFERDLMRNIIMLHEDLVSMTYEHLVYEFFRIYDPKLRDIHKASVRDRLLHHALHRRLYPFFDKKFIADSFSCRLNKGTHKAVNRFRSFAYEVSKNHTRTVWVLKCDIRKFFASVDQEILIGILSKCVFDEDLLELLSKVIKSFCPKKTGIGLPLGNLTSQLLVNIYMNEFDQFMKHELKVRYYIRYADDFVVMSQDKIWLEFILLEIKSFLLNKLKLELHPSKISIRTIASGVDYLGWVNFTDHRVLRTTTKKRMFRNIECQKGRHVVMQSYLGLLRHGNARGLKKEVVKRSICINGQDILK